MIQAPCPLDVFPRRACLALGGMAMAIAAHTLAASGPSPAARPDAPASSAAAAPAAQSPRIADTRVYKVLQTVELNDVSDSARQVRFWVAIPGDGPWQRVLSRRVVEAPAGWTLVRVPESGGEMIYSELSGAPAGGAPVKVVVETVVRRDAPAVDVGSVGVEATLSPEERTKLFAEFLRLDAPNMVVDEKVRALAKAACAGETDPRRKVVKLLEATADAADHYSKDATKPHCGRGSAEDCMANGGGCCTDLHSLFIALARAEGIPARLQMGYRLRPDREGASYDPSYRCWVEYWLDGSGWVPTDIVVADSGEAAARSNHWGTLDARRVWLWEGRGFNLTPRQAAPPIQTMHAGWAEIDGKPVDVLPAEDGTPSRIRRTISFQELTDAGH